MLTVFTFYRPVAVCPFTPARSTLPGAPGDSSGGCLVIIPIHQHKHGRREAGSPGELIPGHRNQAKSQWAAGEVAAVTSSQSTLSSNENRAAPRLSAQLSRFLSTSAGQKGQSLPEPR